MTNKMQDTQLIAYASIGDELPRRERQVYECFTKIGPASNRQISVELNIDINQVTGRTNTLVNESPKCVYLFDKHRDAKTGRTVIRWDVVRENKQLELL